MIINCLLHVHSSFSYDSRTDLADIARVARKYGYRAVLMSEHNNRMGHEEMAAFVRRCDELSDDQLLIIPGLELAFDHNRVHLLAYGIRTYIDSTHAGCTFKSLVEAVRQAGGVAVLAHPSHRQAIERLCAEDCRALDGIEIWNVKNGNRFVPTASDLRLLEQIRNGGGQPFAFAGVDWHHLANFSPLVVRLEAPVATCTSVLANLRAGHFTIGGRFFSVPSSGDTRAMRLTFYDVTGRTLETSRRAAYRWQAKLERRGFKTPRVIAAAARRLF